MAEVPFAKLAPLEVLELSWEELRAAEGFWPSRGVAVLSSANLE